MILIFLSSYLTSTTFIPEFWISVATSLVITSSFPTKSSPVSGLITSSYATMFVILDAKFNFLLYLYLPTLAKSYLLSSKNNPLNKFLAASTVGNSPGLSFLYISIKASSCVFIGSFAIVAINLSSSPKKSIIWSSVNKPIALNNDVTGNFLVLSILTQNTSLLSVSYSSHAPLIGITVDV